MHECLMQLIPRQGYHHIREPGLYVTYHALVNVEINGTNQELLCFIVEGTQKTFYVLLAKFGDLF